MMNNSPRQTEKINNPILPGFNPDPSICRVGSDYYIATSTFEWYPGVQIHHSTDLVNWQLIARPLNRPDLLNMLGTPDSCGVWAPCLSYHDGLFYLVFTDVKRFDGNFKDTHNYITTCTSISGEWSSPIFVNSSGFDPSIFHDDDGRKWFLNMLWDQRPDRSPFQGILMQEFCLDNQNLVGEPKLIFSGTELGCTEGPHLFKKDGYYYLFTAEGGTGYEHAETVARSRNILGPYEVDPNGPLITSKHHLDNYLQRTGHGQLIETENDEFYFVHLCSRPITDKRRSPMGRETAIQKVRFTDEKWFELAESAVSDVKNVGQQYVELPINTTSQQIDNSHFDDFNTDQLPLHYQWLRTPYPEEFIDLHSRASHLRLKGMESVGSTFKQALVARRQQAFIYQATTKIDFEPKTIQQQAGIINYYNASKYHYLYISRDEKIGKFLGIMSCEGDLSLNATFPLWDALIPLPENSSVYLQATVDHQTLHFSYSLDGEHFSLLNIDLDATVTSDEAGKGEGANFTGAFIGLCCQDLTGMKQHADFDFFDYQEKQSNL